MKKVILFIVFAFIGLGAIAQGENHFPKQETNHEIKLDVTELIILSTFELNYEYVISKFSGVGAAISYNFSDEDDDSVSGQNLAFTPYFRQYFFNKKEYGAQGIFIEVNGQVARGEDNYEQEVSIFEIESTTSKDWSAVGAGFAVGNKWLSNNGFVFEVSAGIGRYFITEDDEIGPGGYFRGGLLVGYRF